MKIIGLIFFLFLDSSYAGENSSVWGKIILNDSVSKHISYQYFIYYQNKGVTEAYPLETTRPDISALAKKHVGQSVRINGQVKEVSLSLDGPKRKILVFIPSEIKPLTLAELSAEGPVDMNPQQVPVSGKKEKVRDSGGMRIGDKLSEGLIYTGAAVMLGNLLFNPAFKKR